LRPFDVEISRTNVAQLLSEPLLRKLPTSHYAREFPEILEDIHLSSIYARELSILVDNVMTKTLRERPDSESFISDAINVFIPIIEYLMHIFLHFSFHILNKTFDFYLPRRQIPCL